MWWSLVRPLLFGLDAERAHRLTMSLLAAWSKTLPTEPSDSDPTRSPRLRTVLLGKNFPNPVGLAAGLDKNAEAVLAWQALGFGFIEVGTVTPAPQRGNPRPRMWRLRSDRALMNRMGFNNDGVGPVARRLAKLRAKNLLRVPIGVNIGKQKETPLEDADLDYSYCFTKVMHVADYVVVNVSSPNTANLRKLQGAEEIKAILDGIAHVNSRSLFSPVPVLLKVAPDLEPEELVKVAKAACDFGADGLVLVNTTVSRQGLIGPVPSGTGGVSGSPLRSLAQASLETLTSAGFHRRMVLIGVGGIMTPGDAVQRIEAKADLLQVLTGFVYNGPHFPRDICRALDATPPVHKLRLVSGGVVGALPQATGA